MWRLIVVTFAFMFWAFYVLSGGADYAPAEGSRQHAAALRAADPEPTTQPRSTAATIVKPVTSPTRARIVLTAAQSGGQQPGAPISEAEKRLRLTLDTARQTPTADSAPTHGVATVAADPDKIARLVAAAGAVRPDPRPATETATAAAQETGDRRDLRKVKSNRVNMRQGPGTNYNVVDKLSRGAEVEVLRDEGDGWVKLRVVETGRIGWMADFLLVAAD